MPNSRNKIYIIVGLIIIVALGIFLSRIAIQTDNDADTPIVVPPRNYMLFKYQLSGDELTLWLTNFQATADEIEHLVGKGKGAHAQRIYTADISSPKEDYINDCSTRGGTFNACGSPCAPDAEICAMHCAYTCTLPTK